MLSIYSLSSCEKTRLTADRHVDDRNDKHTSYPAWRGNEVRGGPELEFRALCFLS